MFTLPKVSTGGSPGTSSVETDATAANLAAAGLLLPNFSIPTTNFNPFLPIPMSLPQMSFTAAQLAQLGLNSNPLLVSPPSYEQAMAHLMNTTPDMVRLAAELTTAGFIDSNKDENKNLRNEISDISESEEDKPLDLSMKRQNSSSTEASTSSAFRPSVIRGNGLTPSPRNTDIKRSASSVSHRVTPDPDVTEHFRRSFSGKWPRRQPSYGHYSPSNHHLSTQSINSGFLTRPEISRTNSPFASAPITKRLSFSSSPRSNCPSPQIRRVSSIPKRSQIIVCEGDNSEGI
uniref:Uncharacterized protein n=1 Tax=Panagrolaimus superbus TaxID=310955 RepID=A0A914Y9J9_9BILA